MLIQSTPLINDMVTVSENEWTGRGSITILKDDIPIDARIWFSIVEPCGVGFVVELFVVGCSFVYLAEGSVRVFGVFLV